MRLITIAFAALAATAASLFGAYAPGTASLAATTASTTATATAWQQQPIDTTGPVWSANVGWAMAPPLTPELAITHGGWWTPAFDSHGTPTSAQNIYAVSTASPDPTQSIDAAYGVATPPGMLDTSSDVDGGGWMVLGTDGTGHLAIWQTTTHGSLASEIPISPPGLSAQSYPLVLACPTTTTCLLGGTVDGQTVIDRTTDGGTAWTQVSLPSGAAQHGLYGLSCSTTANCFALLDGPSSVFLTSTDGGTAWAATAAPTGLPQAPLSDEGLVCNPGYLAMAPTCWAAGATGVVEWNGSSWSTAELTPEPVVAVTCGAVFSCEALTATTGAAALAFGTNGPSAPETPWTWSLSPPSPGIQSLVAEPGVNYSPLSCYSGSCDLLGRQISGTQELLALQGTSSGWTVGRLGPVPVPGALDAVSLGSSCAAVAGATGAGTPFSLASVEGQVGPTSLGPAGSRFAPGVYGQTLPPSGYVDAAHTAVWCADNGTSVVVASAGGIEAIGYTPLLTSWPSGVGETGQPILACDGAVQACLAGATASTGTGPSHLLLLDMYSSPGTTQVVSAPPDLAPTSVSRQPLACGDPSGYTPSGNPLSTGVCIAVVMTPGGTALEEATLSASALGAWHSLSAPLSDPTAVACGDSSDADPCAIWAAGAERGALYARPGVYVEGSPPGWYETASVPGVSWISIGRSSYDGGPPDPSLLAVANAGSSGAGSGTTQYELTYQGGGAAFSTVSPATSPIECIRGYADCGAIDGDGWQVGPLPVPTSTPPTTTPPSTPPTTTPPSTPPTTTPPTTVPPAHTPPSTPPTTTPPTTVPPAHTVPPTVPPTHTGEPWAGYGWWLLVGVLSAAGIALLFATRRRRPRHGQSS